MTSVVLSKWWIQGLWDGFRGWWARFSRSHALPWLMLAATALGSMVWVALENRI